MKKLVRDKERIPVYYGYAYYDFVRDAAVCYPYPFNWFVKIIVLAYRRIVGFEGWRITKDREIYQDGFHNGFLAGKMEKKITEATDKQLLINRTMIALMEAIEKKDPQLINKFITSETGIKTQIKFTYGNENKVQS